MRFAALRHNPRARAGDSDDGAAAQPTHTPSKMPDYHPDALITIAVSATSALSALSCGFILLSYYRFASLRQHPASLVVARCAADLFFCLGTFASHITPFSSCEAWSFFTQLFAIAAELYTLTQAVDLVLSVSNPFGSYIKHLRTYHALVWAAAVASAALLLGLRDVGGRPFFGRDPFVGVCWIRRLDPEEKGWLSGLLGADKDVVFFFVAPLVLVYGASGVGLLVAMWRLSRGLHETLDSRVAVFRSTYRFIGGFMLYWLSVVGAYAAVTATGSSAAEGAVAERLSIVLAFALGSRGVVTGVVYFSTYGRDVPRVLCSCRARASSVEDSLEELNRHPRLARELRTETLYYVTHGIVRASLHGARFSAAVDGHHAPRSMGKGPVAFNRFPLSRRNEERGLFSPRQRSTRAAAAAAVAAAAALEEDVGGADGDLQEPLVAGINSVTGESLEGGTGSYLRAIAGRPSMQSMTEEEREAEEQFMAGGGCCGRCYAPRRAWDLDGEEVYSSHTANLLMSLLFPATHAHFIFSDLEPHLFRRLRALNGVSEDAYVRAIASATREQPSEGASSAFLYFSSCDRFIVKTLDPSEKDVLLGACAGAQHPLLPHTFRTSFPSTIHPFPSTLPDIISAFETHLTAHPNTLITRFLGCYALKMYGSTQYFCVMKNVLTSDGATVHERYDLKGSWIHRHHKAPVLGQRVVCRYCGQDFRVGTRRGDNQCPQRPNHQHEPNTILLDNDWDYKLRLSRPQARALVSAIIADTEWLRDHGIMDYSLLLGIHRSRYNLLSLGSGGGVGGGAAAQPRSPERADAAAPVPVPRAHPLSIIPPPGEDGRTLDGLPASMGSPFGAASSFLGATLSTSSLALSVDTGGSGTPRTVADLPTATLSLAAEGVMYDEQDSGAGPLFVEAKEARPRSHAPAAPPPSQPPSLFHEHHGGMRAVVVEGPGIYYIGMIDVLQRWTFKKRLENWLKTHLLFQDVSGLSAVPPALYAARFKTRVLAQLIDGWEDGDHAAANTTV
jgi:1-phosphatidylinositol-4-phosphate 5-kinase